MQEEHDASNTNITTYRLTEEKHYVTAAVGKESQVLLDCDVSTTEEILNNIVDLRYKTEGI